METLNLCQRGTLFFAIFTNYSCNVVVLFTRKLKNVMKLLLWVRIFEYI